MLCFGMKKNEKLLDFTVGLSFCQYCYGRVLADFIAILVAFFTIIAC